MMNLDFEVLVKDKVTAHVKVVNNVVDVQRFTNIAYEQPFLHQPVSLEFVKHFLKRRAVSADKEGIDEILRNLGIEKYDVVDILKKTHGVDWDDFMWIRFKGDKTQYNDIKLR